jgi:hypothetical protein
MPWLWTARINGALLLQSSNTTNTFTASPQLGGSFVGNIAEMLVFDRVLSPEERDAVGVYLNSKYTLTTNLPPVPYGLHGTSAYPYQLTITWTNSVSTNGLVYTLERKTGTAGTYAKLAAVRDAQTFTDTTVTAGTSYYYRLKSWNFNGYSSYSADFSPPTVSLTNPPPQYYVGLGTNFTAGAVATALGSSVANVKFYLNNSLLSTASSAPYGASLSGLTAGAYTVQAKVTDANGNTAYSQQLTFVVSPDSDGDGIPDALEIANGTNPAAADTDGDGVSDMLDAFPLDPTRSSVPSADPSDHTAPTIYLDEPLNAVLVP